MTGAVLTPEKVNGYIRRIFEAETLLHDILVAGEISNFVLSGTTAYFVLKDERAGISCVCFDARQKGCLFRNGERIVVRATPDFYPRTGRLSLLVSKVSAATGQGMLALKYAALKERLEREGKFDPARKRPLPRFARTVGVVTSRTGAVIHDIMTVARRRNPAVNLLLSPVRVQGVGAEADVARGIRLISGQDVDVVIVARGGGSSEDIEPFYTEEVVDAVLSCPVPVVSAVGHETDVTLCDYAADVRAATPSVAAELCVFSAEEYESEVRSALSEGFRALERRAEWARFELQSVASGLSARGSELYVRNFQLVKNIVTELYRGVSDRYYAACAETERERARLERLNPASVLAAGYARIARGGKIVARAEELGIGDVVKLTLSDGERLARIIGSEDCQ